MAISTQYGQSGEYFGHADYAGNISAGSNPLQILDYLNQNMGKLRGINVPGGGGIYDIVSQDAVAFKQQQETQQRIQQQQQAFQQQMEKQRQLAAQQLAEQQKQAQEAQRQLMINMQRGDRAPAAVKTTSSGAEKTGLTRRGTTGYFGRSGMRIGSLNVPSTGLAITPNMQMPTSGSFA